MNLIGDVRGKVAVLVDDMIDSECNCSPEMNLELLRSANVGSYTHFDFNWLLSCSCRDNH